MEPAFLLRVRPNAIANVVFAHATGFCKEVLSSRCQTHPQKVWGPVISSLDDVLPFNYLSFDFRGHGQSTDSSQNKSSCQFCGFYVPQSCYMGQFWRRCLLHDKYTRSGNSRCYSCSDLTRQDLPIYGVGHSKGATSLLLTQLHSQPPPFRHCVLFEPISYPPEFGGAQFLYDAVCRRRETFSSRFGIGERA
jgi:hypothetical protein